MRRKVAIIVGSNSDSEKAEEAMKVLQDLGIEGECRVLSAHRNPEALREFVKKSDAEVFIAIAGLSAALPGFIASYTLKPVIGVPREVKLGGLDAILSIVQMPFGVPVACVGLDNARNAALLAARILAISDEDLRERLLRFQKAQSQ
ncbi:5-(carboxyamino)imidazole ribonucleotide mutase [Candidatus Bathyarchaeota archaeon]|nr:5-(carboxyamino)imidazole ribonucleotide mutase [Candidatus Bathyarchaeota archaeon]